MRRLAAGVLVLAALAGHASAEPAFPVTIEGGRVTVRAEAGLEAPARKLATLADARLAAIEADLAGLPRASRIEARLVKHAQDLAAAAPNGRGAPAWAVGTAYPEEGVVVLAARSRGGDLVDLPATLAHELAHVALAHALGDRRVPRWLTEGFAYLVSSDFSLTRAATLGGAVLRGRVVPILALEDAFPAREDEASLAYAESYDFVVFLARRGRWEDAADDGDRFAFQQFLVELAGGETVDGAARAAFGRPFAALEAEWRQTLEARYLWYPIGALSALIWVVAGALLVLGWLRRRRYARRQMRRWELEEAIEDAARRLADRKH